MQGLPKFLEYPLLFQEQVMLRTSNFCKHIHRIDRNKNPLKISGKVAAWTYSGTLENFQGTHILGASRGHLSDNSAFLYDKLRIIIVWALRSLLQ